MKWVTRERPKIDRIACPWLVARFIDGQPEFLFVAPDQVLETARISGAIPYDVPGVERTHVGELMLRHGIVMYDALYAWCCHARGESHRWNY